MSRNCASDAAPRKGDRRRYPGFGARLEVSRHLAAAVVPPRSISIDVAKMDRTSSAVVEERFQIVKAHSILAEKPGQRH